MSSDAEDETPRFFRCEGSQNSDESAPRRALQISARAQAELGPGKETQIIECGSACASRSIKVCGEHGDGRWYT